MRDPNDVYFEYKWIKAMIFTFLCLIAIGAATMISFRYIDRQGKQPDNEYTVQLKYLELGYVQKTCGKCTAPTWLPATSGVHCPLDNTDCK